MSVPSYNIGLILMANFIVKNLKQFQQALQKADKDRIKAAQTAVKIEGFRLSKALKADIRSGAPGGRAFSPLSTIASIRRHGKNKSPLFRLAIPVRYRVDYQGGNMTMQIGYINPGKGKGLSKSWQRLAMLHQAGGKIPVTEDMRKALAAIGAHMKRNKANRSKANVFFLKPTTTHINIPARPIIEPFWDAHKQETEQNIVTNFYRKMQGERI